MKLYEEIKAAMSEVMEAEQNAKAWAIEARTRMKSVDVIIRAAQKIDPEAAKLGLNEIKGMVRADLTPPTESTDPDEYLERETATAEPVNATEAE